MRKIIIIVVALFIIGICAALFTYQSGFVSVNETSEITPAAQKIQVPETKILQITEDIFIVVIEEATTTESKSEARASESGRTHLLSTTTNTDRTFYKNTVRELEVILPNSTTTASENEWFSLQGTQALQGTDVSAVFNSDDQTRESARMAKDYLLSNNFIEATSQAADGPGSSQQGYVNKSNAQKCLVSTLFSYTSYPDQVFISGEVIVFCET